MPRFSARIACAKLPATWGGGAAPPLLPGDSSNGALEGRGRAQRNAAATEGGRGLRTCCGPLRSPSGRLPLAEHRPWETLAKALCSFWCPTCRLQPGFSDHSPACKLDTASRPPDVRLETDHGASRLPLSLLGLMLIALQGCCLVLHFGLQLAPACL